MKKVLFILGLMLTFSSFAAEDKYIPVVLTDGVLSPQVVETNSNLNSDLIDVKAMKNADRVEQAKEEASSIEKPNKIQVNYGELEREYALQYTTHQLNMMGPLH